MTQSEALNILKLGQNVFLTGAAGAGKTYLLNKYISHLREFGVRVAITASTGIAATHLNGQTIHSWAGFGIRDSITNDELKDLATKDRIKRNFTKTNVLIIDEVSMLHPYQLDTVDRLGRQIRNPFQPFGGLQVVLCGDFFQLPPVTRNTNSNEIKFAYECSAWEQGNFQTCYLTEQHRQQNDPLLDILNHIRSGETGEPTKAPLRYRYKQEPVGGGQATRLFVRNVNVDALNAAELKKLPYKTKAFKMKTRGFRKLTDTLKRNCLAQEKLVLKIDAEVMFIKNATDGKYVNGTRGQVIGFERGELPIVRTLAGDEIVVSPEEWLLEENGVIRASLTQIPLRLAWAITIHKSQGMTLDTAEVDLSDAFEAGMGYVALSRIRTLNGLKLMGLNEIALTVHPKILAHDAQLRELSQIAAQDLAKLPQEEIINCQQTTLTERFKGSALKGKLAKEKKSKPVGEPKTPTHQITAQLIKEKKSINEIAKARNIKISTVFNHLEKLNGLNILPDISYLKPADQDFGAILAAFAKSEDGKLTPIYEKFNGKYDFDTLRIVRLLIKN